VCDGEEVAGEGDLQFDLQRFVDAQARVYDTALAELRAGRKRTHWIWFVFPQLAELGRSPTARHYGISGLAEARAYLAHDVLSTRLRECSAVVAATTGRSIEDVFGFPDYLKVRSSMTLFARATADNREFVEVLDTFYAGEGDPETVRLLTADRG
jgi:uncharacterized protein (DUF1810 family)